MSAKRRRSKRVSKSERVLLSITDPTEIQDVVVTLEVSQHGAKVLARRKLPANSRGTATFIAGGKQVPCRVAWQRPPGAEGRMETGLEIYPTSVNFWGVDLQGSEVDRTEQLVLAEAPAIASAPVPPAAPDNIGAMVAEWARGRRCPLTCGARWWITSKPRAFSQESSWSRS